MNPLRLLWKFMKGNRLIYLGAVISIGLAIFFSILNPLVLRVTIDSIIGNEPLDVPEWIENIIYNLGGKTVLMHNLWICAACLVFLTLLRGVFLYYKGKWSAKASESITKNIRETLYNHIQHLPYDYHVKAETGDLIQRCTSDVDTIRRFLAVQLVEIGRAIFMISIASIIMFSLNVKMAFIALTVVPIIFVFSAVFFMKVQKAFKISDEAEARMSTVLQENFNGVRVVRAFGRQKYEIDKFDERNSEYKKVTYRLIKLLAYYWSLSDVLCLSQIGLVVVLGTYWAATGTITMGTLVVFTSYEGMLLWPVRQLGRILSDLGKMMVSLRRIDEILSEPVEKPKKCEIKPNIEGNISFKNVSFEYEEGRPVLKNISFDVKKGQTVALMGQTGSGKSSLIHLLARLYDYQSGSIKIDGVELKNIDKKWIRKNIGIVLQEPFLFSRTIKENISLARHEADETEVIEAARVAAIHDVILDYDKGYETPVGERGVTLSGGQKQRIAIARTIINDSPILIFDDSLSAVDTETDAAIRKALKERKKDVTTFIISHRVSTLSEADLIIVLDKGKIVQSGTHDELIEQPGLYKRVWAIQNALEEDFEQELNNIV
ncbi:ABC transporter ATP-binding protein [Caldisalinibacter kiritimatiensis]|uniref:Lipid A export ATP-binding/permease protein MsbA n=1 Tax=Caldisalinibacter kiritimatiensis TaxID=1304284 RepID=R1CLF9_9FIRM|nr:ABC transporter ATP-binding protein [Caldisalinibacter kiritimatiensis]EOC99510.1 Lipid A export ATP-binding/permease protein MsbA [Caldisalinibacter kiritimatiensis]